MVQPRYELVLPKSVTAIFFLLKEHVFGGSNPPFPTIYAGVAELVYAADLKSAAERIGGSNPLPGTIKQ